ncbi:MAG: glycosyl hydrolase family 25 [Bacteroidaceae bacterium]|nr:glycosyl hydrolase family 25 [Bacteroidaceae bacterium]
MDVSHQHEHHVGLSTDLGIDVSHYQGNINWQEVARSGEVRFVYIKATEGGSLVDNTYRTNLAGAKRAGLKVGVYHFFSPRVPVPDQVRNFTQNVNLRDMDLIPIIDVEHIKGVTKEQLCARLKRFLEQVERHYGVRPILYSYARFYNNYLAQDFSHYKFMIARYHTDIPELVNDVPFVMWQYTNVGRVPGIRGDVDRSRFMDNYGITDILLRK